EEPGGDEQRIARQEETEEQARLREDDQRQPHLADNPDQLRHVVDRFEELLDEIHRIGGSTRTRPASVACAPAEGTRPTRPRVRWRGLPSNRLRLRSPPTRARGRR